MERGRDCLTGVGFYSGVRGRFWNRMEVVLYNTVNVLHATEVITLKALILCNFTSTKYLKTKTKPTRVGKTELRGDQLELPIRGGGVWAEEGRGELGTCGGFGRVASPEWRKRMRCPSFCRTGLMVGLASAWSTKAPGSFWKKSGEPSVC